MSPREREDRERRRRDLCGSYLGLLINQNVLHLQRERPGARSSKAHALANTRRRKTNGERRRRETVTATATSPRLRSYEISPFSSVHTPGFSRERSTLEPPRQVVTSFLSEDTHLSHPIDPISFSVPILSFCKGKKWSEKRRCLANEGRENKTSPSFSEKHRGGESINVLTAEAETGECRADRERERPGASVYIGPECLH